MTGDDRDLYEAFAAVRREDEARVPAMAVVLAVGGQRGRGRMAGRLVAVAACLAMVIAGALRMVRGSRVRDEGLERGRAETAASITAWRPATDFLLETPGRELLQSVPDVGAWRGDVIAPGLEHRHRGVRFRK